MTDSGFWSYAREDDEAEGGRIKMLAHDVEAQYKFATGQPLTTFLDATDLGWGDDWEARINEALVSTRFFIPVITTSYLQSEQCRREFRLFTQTASELGLGDLVLSIIWGNVPGIGEGPGAENEIVALVNKFHWEDWRQLRFEEPHSKEYRKAVAALAERLAAIAPAPSGALIEASEKATEDDLSAPGVLDLAAASEEAMPRLLQTLDDVGTEIVAIGAVSRESVEKIEEANARGQAIAGRLTIMRTLAKSLDPHAERIEALARDFTSDLYDLDGGIRGTLEFFLGAPTDDEPERAARCKYGNDVLGLTEAAGEGMDALRNLVSSILPLEGLSRDLRRPLKTIREGLSLLAEGDRVMSEWAGPARAVGEMYC